MSTPSDTPSYRPSYRPSHTPTAAWAWVDHLRSGGSTRWSHWVEQWEGEAAELPDRPLPGAQQLELVRRLNAAGETTPELRERVLATSLPGRGLQELDLAGTRDSGFGTRPVFPREIPLHELLRLGSGVLADLARESALPERRTPGPVPRRPLLRRLRGRLPGAPQAYRLVGDPMLARPLRGQLRRAGRPPGGRSPVAVVMLADYGEYVADVWASRVVRGGRTWSAWVDVRAGATGLPGRLDPVRLARAWAERLGRERVLLAFEPAEVAATLGVPVLEPPRRPSHAELEVVRRTAIALRVSTTRRRRRQVLRRLVTPWAAAGAGAAAERLGLAALPPPAVPRRHRAWLDTEACRVRGELAEAGYSVLGGSLDRLVPREPVRTTSPHNDEVLTVMLHTLLQADRTAGSVGGRQR